MRILLVTHWRAALAPGPGKGAAAAPAPSAVEQTGAVARAIALLLDFDRNERRITVGELAHLAGCSRATLYRDQQFKAALMALKSKRQGKRPPHGYKDACGNVDAEQYDDA